jgi:hypothetical protein
MFNTKACEAPDYRLMLKVARADLVQEFPLEPGQEVSAVDDRSDHQVVIIDLGERDHITIDQIAYLIDHQMDVQATLIVPAWAAPQLVRVDGWRRGTNG